MLLVDGIKSLRHQIGLALRNAVILLAGTVLAQGLTVLSLWITARHLGVDAYGQYAAIYALLTQAIVLLNFGLDIWLLRVGAEPDAIFAQSINEAFSLKLAFSVAWCPGVIIAAWMLNRYIYPVELMAAAVPGIVCQALSTLAQSAFQARLRNEATAALKAVAAGSLLVVSVGLANGQGTLTQFIWGRTLALFVVAVLGTFMVARTWTIRLQSFAKSVGLLRRAVPYMLTDAFTQIYVSADVTIIAIMRGKTASGIYAPAITLASALVIVPSVAHFVMLPLIAHLHVEEPAKVRPTALLTLATVGSMGIVLALATFLWRDSLVQFVYGPEFAATAKVLAILSGVLFIRPMNFALAAILTATDRQRRRVLVQGLTAMSNVVLNLWAVPSFGLTGAAVVYVITETILLTGYMVSALPVLRSSGCVSSLSPGH